MTNLEKLRKEKGFTRQELADRVGVATSTIQRIENGTFNYRKVKIGTLFDCAKALNVELLDIIDIDRLKS